MPAHLTDEAKVEWGRISQELYQLGLLSNIDRAVLAMYCQSWARWVKAEQKIAETAEVGTTKGGNIIENPWYSISKRERELAHKFLTEFGMSPASRTRISAQPRATPGAAKSKWGSFGK